MQISQNVRAFLTLMRLPYIIVLSFLCVLFIITFQKGLNDPALIGLAVIAVTFTSAGSAAINDYCDRDSDVLTHPERPISANQISPIRAAQFSAVSYTHLTLPTNRE